MIVPYTPGGYTDFMARIVGQKLSEVLGQPFVFENRPGANSVIGADAVGRAGVVAQVDRGFVRRAAQDLAQDGQAADAGVEEADGS